MISRLIDWYAGWQARRLARKWQHETDVERARRIVRLLDF